MPSSGQNLSSIPRAHVTEGETRSLQVVLAGSTSRAIQSAGPSAGLEELGREGPSLGSGVSQLLLLGFMVPWG